MNKLIICIISLLLIAACDQTVQQSSAVDAPNEARVELKDFAFSPSTVTMKRGGTITFVNNDDTTHTVSSSDFDSGDVKAGEEFQQTLTKTGSYNVKCKYHPSMTMKIIVK